MGRWRAAWATAIGTAHVRSGLPCQDAAGCRVVTGADGREVLLLAASDGAGSAARSEAGAALAVESLLAALAAEAVRDGSLEGMDEAFAQGWLAALQGEMAELAAREGCPVEALACTVLGAAVAQDAAAFLQLGDGAIVVSDGAGGLDWVFWPQHGEFANSTFFVTQAEAAGLLQVRHGPAPEEVALFTDGIERLVLDMAGRTVHGPAFRPILDWLAGTAPGQPEGPSPALAAFLASDQVNRRTDDDKTLVMATRAAAPAAG